MCAPAQGPGSPEHTRSGLATLLSSVADFPSVITTPRAAAASLQHDAASSTPQCAPGCLPDQHRMHAAC